LSVLVICLGATGPALVAAAGSAATAALRPTTIVGVAWNADDSPIPDARVRLRNLASGRLEAAAVGNAAGHFTFSGVAGGSYVIELVNDRGRVLAVSHAFVVAQGETVATFVRLGTRVPWFAGFFRNAAAAAVSSAASLGVTALTPVAPPVSAKR
jgi:hypothetical protein